MTLIRWPGTSHERLAECSDEYAYTAHVVGVLSFLLYCVVALLLWPVAHAVGTWQVRGLPPNGFYLTVSPLLWLLVAVLGAPAVWAPLHKGLTKLVLKDRFAEYMQFRRQKCGSDSFELRLVVWGTSVAAILLLGLGSDYYFAARPEADS